MMFIGLWAALLAPSAAADSSAGGARYKPADMLGKAFRPGSDELLYRERHQYTINASGQLEHQVDYSQANGEPWAHKRLFYQGRATAPSFTLTDTLQQESVAVTLTDNTIAVKHDQNEAQHRYQLNKKSPLVIDAGFDAFIKRHWRSLSNGQAEAFYFLLPRREKLVKLRLTPQPCREFEPDQHLCLALEVNNWLLRLLVESIELTYQRDPRRLVRYLGVSNLRFAPEQGSPQVDIRYQPVTASKPQLR
jgi:hypothetical protein